MASCHGNGCVEPERSSTGAGTKVWKWASKGWLSWAGAGMAATTADTSTVAASARIAFARPMPRSDIGIAHRFRFGARVGHRPVDGGADLLGVFPQRT